MKTLVIESGLNTGVNNALPLGAKVYNTAFEGFSRQGEIISNPQGAGVRFYYPDHKSYKVVPFTQKWQLLPSDIPFVDLGNKEQGEKLANKWIIEASAPINIMDMNNKPLVDAPKPIKPLESVKPSKVLDDILNNSEKPLPAKIVSIGKDAVISLESESLTSDEKKELNKLVKEFSNNAKTFESIPIRQCRILAEIRDKRLWKGFKSFIDFAITTFKKERQHLQEMAKIGGLISLLDGIIQTDKLELSQNTYNAISKNNSRFSDSYNLKDAELKDFRPFLEQVLDVTTKAVKSEKAEKVNVSPKNIDSIFGVINNFLDGKIDKNNVLPSAAKTIFDNKTSLVTNSQTALAAKPTPKEKPLEVACGHTIDNSKIVSIIDGILTLSCGCQFKQFFS